MRKQVLLLAVTCLLAAQVVLCQKNISAKEQPTTLFRPTDQVVCPGDPAIFDLGVEQHLAPLCIQWQINTDGKHWSDIRGADGAVFRFAEACDTNCDGTQVRAKIESGNDWVFSKPASVRVAAARRHHLRDVRHRSRVGPANRRAQKERFGWISARVFGP